MQPMKSKKKTKNKNNASNVIYFHFRTIEQVVGGFVLPVENARLSQTAQRCVSVRLSVRRDTNQCVE